VCGHLLRVLKRAAVGEVRGDPGCTERVAADFRPSIIAVLMSEALEAGVGDLCPNAQTAR
jgi:hypothetical protein